MIETSLNMAFDAAWLLILALLTLVFYRALRWGAALLPLPPTQRGLVRRAVPILGAGLLFVYLVFAARRTLAKSPDLLPWTALGIALLLLLFAWGPLRDVVTGFFFRISERCEPGEKIAIDDLEGRVLTVGLFGLCLETARGDRAVIPYSKLASSTVVRRSDDQAIHARVFRVQLSPSADVIAACRVARQAGLLHHWSSPCKDPRVEALDGGDLEATVFPIHKSRGLAIEDAVRQALEDHVGATSDSP